MIFRVTEQALSIDEAYRSVLRPECGAVCLFVGTVRDHHDGKAVGELRYSAFAEMAEAEFRKIAEEASQRWRLGGWYIAHRVGKLSHTEASVVIAVSAPHRAEAFEAARFAIERLKEVAPIWKEEFYEDGKAWIGGDPS